MEKLKPCPFCGGSAITRIRTINGTVYACVVCKLCGSEQSEGFGSVPTFESAYRAMEQAADCWNRRKYEEEEVGK